MQTRKKSPFEVIDFSKAISPEQALSMLAAAKDAQRTANFSSGQIFRVEGHDEIIACFEAE